MRDSLQWISALKVLLPQTWKDKIVSFFAIASTFKIEIIHRSTWWSDSGTAQWYTTKSRYLHDHGSGWGWDGSWDWEPHFEVGAPLLVTRKLAMLVGKMSQPSPYALSRVLPKWSWSSQEGWPTQGCLGSDLTHQHERPTTLTGFSPHSRSNYQHW